MGAREGKTGEESLGKQGERKGENGERIPPSIFFVLSRGQATIRPGREDGLGGGGRKGGRSIPTAKKGGGKEEGEFGMINSVA